MVGLSTIVDFGIHVIQQECVSHVRTKIEIVSFVGDVFPYARGMKKRSVQIWRILLMFAMDAAEGKDVPLRKDYIKQQFLRKSMNRR